MEKGGIDETLLGSVRDRGTALQLQASGGVSAGSPGIHDGHAKKADNVGRSAASRHEASGMAVPDLQRESLSAQHSEVKKSSMSNGMEADSMFKSERGAESEQQQEKKDQPKQAARPTRVFENPAEEASRQKWKPKFPVPMAGGGGGGINGEAYGSPDRLIQFDVDNVKTPASHNVCVAMRLEAVAHGGGAVPMQVAGVEGVGEEATRDYESTHSDVKRPIAEKPAKDEEGEGGKVEAVQMERRMNAAASDGIFNSLMSRAAEEVKEQLLERASGSLDAARKLTKQHSHEVGQSRGDNGAGEPCGKFERDSMGQAAAPTMVLSPLGHVVSGWVNFGDGSEGSSKVSAMSPNDLPSSAQWESFHNSAAFSPTSEQQDAPLAQDEPPLLPPPLPPPAVTSTLPSSAPPLPTVTSVAPPPPAIANYNPFPLEELLQTTPSITEAFQQPGMGSICNQGSAAICALQQPPPSRPPPPPPRPPPSSRPLESALAESGNGGGLESRRRGVDQSLPRHPIVSSAPGSTVPSQNGRVGGSRHGEASSTSTSSSHREISVESLISIGVVDPTEQVSPYCLGDYLYLL